MGTKICLVLLLIPLAYCQELAGSSIADSLLICYNTTEYREKFNRIPATINVLIDLIRTVEDGKSSQDARNFATELVHRFRQDGIISMPTTNPDIVPYSPLGPQIFKNALILKELIPGNAEKFPNETLTNFEMCALHFILSNTIDIFERGDESSVCNRIGSYTRRIKREVEHFDAVDNSKLEDGVGNKDAEPIPRSAKDLRELSECPIESGVIYTKWGSVQAGTVLAGLAAGLEPQKINVNNELTIESPYAVTLSGDIAEIATLQSISYNSQNVGSKGSWNSTLAPRYYFIQEQKTNQMTDAEVRAGLDGLIIAKNVEDWKRKFSNIKVSQILDMYYSQIGVFDKKFRACKRKELRSEYATKEDLEYQSFAMSIKYNDVARAGGTVPKELLSKYVNNSVKNFLEYDVNMNDLSCDSDEQIDRIATDVTIILDSDWNYDDVYPAISYVLDNLEISKYSSNYTVISAGSGYVITNSTYRIYHFHEYYNKTLHSKLPRGFDGSATMKVAEDLLKERNIFEAKSNIKVPRSNIVLFVMSSASIASNGAGSANSAKSRMSSTAPDLKYMVLGTGNKEGYSGLASTNDVFILNYGSDSSIIDSIKPLIRRIAEVPRNLRHPLCDTTGDMGTSSWELNIEPDTINFYKVAPKYFGSEGEHKIRIRPQSGGSLNVCTSRSDTRPMQNSSTCKTLNSGEESYDLSDCSESCSPFYLSVEAVSTGSSSTASCTDNLCRFPTNIKFTITGENLVCTRSAADRIISGYVLATVIITFIGKHFLLFRSA